MTAEHMDVNLPGPFLERMKQILGAEYQEFLDSYENKRVYGLRFNPLKGPLSVMVRENQSRFCLRPVLWCREGYYYDADTRPGRHPLHEAGVFYIQEPSAMAVVELLDPQPGETVLDLCAAPGGKTVQIGGRLNGRGLLVSNEIHPERARILSRNVERMGITNAVVTNESPERMQGHFPEFFDRIVVDAPCSGEGMFRKDVKAGETWSEDNIRLCAKRQQMIMDCAARMLKPGGRLVYSTCTFAPEENEEGVAAFLAGHRDFTIEAAGFPGLAAGRPGWSRIACAGLEHTCRIWPHQAAGEGHYMAVLRKGGELRQSVSRQQINFWNDKEGREICRTFVDNTLHTEIDMERLILFGGQVYRLPERLPRLSGLKILRPGLHIGTLKKNRLEPAHALALSLRPGQARQSISLPSDGREIVNYLSGHTLPSRGREKGWVLVCADGYSAGWAKASSGILKNHYPKGLRTAVR